MTQKTAGTARPRHIVTLAGLTLATLLISAGLIYLMFFHQQPADEAIQVVADPITSTPAPAHTPEEAPAATPTPEPTPEPAAVPFRPAIIDVAGIPALRTLPEVVMDVDLIYDEGWMRVRQTAAIPNLTSHTWHEIVFNVPLMATDGAFHLLEAAAASADPGSGGIVEAVEDGITLRVPLPRPLLPNQTAYIRLTYRVDFLPVENGSTFPIGLTGEAGDVLRAGEWYPVLAPYRNGQGWQTYTYHPVGDPIIYPAANYSLNISTQPGITIAGGGPVGREDTLWQFRVEQARGMAFFASDRFWRLEDEVDGILIESYYLPPYVGAGRAVIDVAAASLRLYADLYGPYPYDSLTIVQNGYRGDMEYTALISLSNRVYENWRGVPISLVHVLVSHETAHQWWYGGVGNDQVHEPWLDEALATYSEILFYERYHPEIGDWRVRLYEEKAEQVFIDTPIYAYENTVEYVDALYPRAALFIGDLRAAMGDEAFFAFLQDYYAQYRGRLATTDQFFTTLRRHAATDLDPLLQDYFADVDW